MNQSADSNNITCVGLGKTLFNSSACYVSNKSGKPEIEIILTERITRQKASGAWPEQALAVLSKNHNLENCFITENRDVVAPPKFEEFLNKSFPFFEYLQKKNLSKYSSHFNENVKHITHHLCHASAALIVSPFEKALILVIDGAGSNVKDFSDGHAEKKFLPPNFEEKDYLEESSVYGLESGKLTCLEKNWQEFKKSSRAEGHWLSEGLGSLYEKAAEYIFNDKRAAGKVMGLAALGRSLKL